MRLELHIVTGCVVNVYKISIANLESTGVYCPGIFVMQKIGKKRVKIFN